MRFPSLLTLLTLFSCNCATIQEGIQHRESALRQGLSDSTVLIFIEMEVTVPRSPLAEYALNLQKTVKVGLACSGVVVARSANILSPKTLIVTANHCLDGPGLGDELEPGMKVMSISTTAYDSRGTRCSLKTVKLGGTEEDDVATAAANCSLGTVAHMATRVPERQGIVYISGHPEGVYPNLITVGFFAGWRDDYMLLSAPAHGGNSGGPVVDSEGRIVGILVRGSGEYDHLTLAAPLGEIMKRLSESRRWTQVWE